MKLKKYVAVFILIFTLSACSSTENSISNEMEGIELQLSINIHEFSFEDGIVANVMITNHNDFRKKIFVPTPKDIEEGIAAVMVEKENKMLYQLLSPKNNQDIQNIKERSFYDFVLVELEANETIEQEFHWNKELLNQENNEIVEADSGKYLVSAFVILDELNDEKEYFEPAKQLISKLNFTVE